MARTIFVIISLTMAIEQVKAPKNFLYDICIGKEVLERTAKFEIQTKDAGRVKSPIVGKREKGVLIEKEGFVSNVYEPSYLKLFTINYAEEMLEQQFGRTKYESAKNASNLELAKNLQRFKDISKRTKLWMLSTLLTTGSCPAASGKVAIKFGDFTKEVLAGDALFSNPEADLIGYFENKQLDIQKKTGKVIDTVVVTPDVAGHVLNNNRVKEYLKDTNATAFIQVSSTKEKATGERKIAYLPTLGITIYSFMDWARNPEEDKEEQLIPDKTVLGLCRGSFETHYGALALKAKQGVRATLHVKKEVVRTWSPNDSEDDEIQYFSAPLIIPQDAQSWFCAQVLA